MFGYVCRELTAPYHERPVGSEATGLGRTFVQPRQRDNEIASSE